MMITIIGVIIILKTSPKGLILWCSKWSSSLVL